MTTIKIIKNIAENSITPPIHKYLTKSSLVKCATGLYVYLLELITSIHLTLWGTLFRIFSVSNLQVMVLGGR